MRNNWNILLLQTGMPCFCLSLELVLTSYCTTWSRHVSLGRSDSTALWKHFHLTPSIIIEHFRLHSQVKKLAESVVSLISELYCLLQFCEFGDSLKNMLRWREPTWFHCHRKGHIVPKCLVSADVVCHLCRKKGHFQRGLQGQEQQTSGT